MKPELVKFQFGPGLLGVLGPGGHAGKPGPFFAGPPLGLGVRIGLRGRFIKRPLGMDMADEVDVLGQVSQHTLAAVGTVAGDDEGVVGKPARRQLDEFDAIPAGGLPGADRTAASRCSRNSEKVMYPITGIYPGGHENRPIFRRRERSAGSPDVG